MLASGFCAAFAKSLLSSCAIEVPAIPSVQAAAMTWMAALDLMNCRFKSADLAVFSPSIDATNQVSGFRSRI